MVNWGFVYCDEASRLHSMILEHSLTAPPDAIPFRSVKREAGELFATCVPLTSLRAAAAGFGKGQSELDALATCDAQPLGDR